MGRSYKTLLCLICSALFAAVFADNALSGVSAVLVDFCHPEYRGDGRLTFIIYGAKARNLGALVQLEKLVLDIVQDNLRDVNDIKPVNNLTLYELGADHKKAMEFWKDLPHCRAIISAPNAVYDKNRRLLTSDGKAYLRMREMDADGVGFSADQKRKFIHIRSQVRVAVRPELRRHADMPEKKKTGVKQ